MTMIPSKKTLPRSAYRDNEPIKIGPFDAGSGFDHVITLRFDDRKGVGFNYFAVHSNVYNGNRHINTELANRSLIKEHAPDLLPYLKWQLVGTTGPMYYRANSIYFASKGNLEAARSIAIWPDAELEDFTDEKLLDRLPDLMLEFKADMESLGFIY